MGNKLACLPLLQQNTRIDSSFPLKSFYKISAMLSHSQFSLVTQIRTGHLPLMKFLYRIKRADSPNCLNCTSPPAKETVHHFLFECPTYTNE